jgi:protein-S-isoprenylcysteine O-methyltransferase Ste14
MLLFGLMASISLNRVIQDWDQLSALELGHAVLSFIFVALLVVLFAIRRPSIGHRPSLTARAIALGATFITFFIPFQPRTIDNWWLLTISDVLMVIGITFSIYALATLGRSFGIAPEARQLVTSGPYRWVRNPAYLAEFVTATAMALPLLSPLTVVIFAAFVTLQLRRIALEEQVLWDTFPEYDEYRRRTPALVPWHLRLSQLRPRSA